MRIAPTSKRLLAALAIVTCLASHTPAEGTDSLSEQFASPGPTHRPLVWWHWLNGNVTKEGIDRDLEAMQAAGIAGFHLFDVTMAAPGPLRFGTEAWRETRDYALRRATEMGFQVGVQVCPGWATLGGPWVAPEDAMKRVVYRETWVEGGRSHVFVPPAPKVAGYYEDIAVLAWPATEAEWQDRLRRPARVTVNAGSGLQTELWFDGDDTTSCRIPEPSAQQPFVIDLEFPDPFTPACLEVTIPPAGWPKEPKATLEAQAPDGTWKMVRSFTLSGTHGNPAITAVSLQPIHARHFRLTFSDPFDHVNPSTICEVSLKASGRLEDWTGQSLSIGWGPTQPADPTAGTHRVDSIDPSQILDLTARLQKDGVLDWQVPSRKWVITRFGATGTNKMNHPAQPEGTGWEVDKMDPEAVRRVISASLGADFVSPGAKISMALIDSWESGSQNWTKDLPQRFRNHCGYDLKSWLPAFTGRSVKSADATRDFFWEFRQFISTEVTRATFGVFREEMEKRGVLAYAEPYGGPFDHSAAGAEAGVPMGEFWLGDKQLWNVKEMSSVAHVLSRPLVAAESFTAGGGSASYREAPMDLKTSGDRAFARGLNQVVLHSYVHQPFDHARPGFSLGQFGTHFNRHESWWPHIRPWVDYLSRCQLLLREGRSVNDLAYARPDDSPTGQNVQRYGDAAPPAGWDFDFVGRDSLLAATCDGKELVLSSGARYRALVLPATDSLSFALAEQLVGWLEKGFPVVGEAPVRLIGARQQGLQDKAKAILRTLSRPHHTTGALIPREKLAAALVENGIQRDFSVGDETVTDLVYAHRSSKDREIYFVANVSNTAAIETAVTFRNHSSRPELWDPMTGAVTNLPESRILGPGKVRLHLEPMHSTFVVFPKTEDSRAAKAAYASANSTVERIPIPQGWVVEVEGGHRTDLQTLRSLTELQDTRLRFAHGHADYQNSFDIPLDHTGKRVRLQLGHLRATTQVWLNGAAVGKTWLPPHEVDLTPFVRAGRNDLRIQVSLPWTNRLVADASLDKGVTFDAELGYSEIPSWVANPPLAPDGLRRSFSSFPFATETTPLEPAGLNEVPTLLID
ncbi:MAG: glycosyl hydrolase [Opitutaceae bacterium]|nr:glycosyl hydrolase [Opitutaceae bacterium]